MVMLKISHLSVLNITNINFNQMQTFALMFTLICPSLSGGHSSLCHLVEPKALINTHAIKSIIHFVSGSVAGSDLDNHLSWQNLSCLAKNCHYTYGIESVSFMGSNDQKKSGWLVGVLKAKWDDLPSLAGQPLFFLCVGEKNRVWQTAIELLVTPPL